MKKSFPFLILSILLSCFCAVLSVRYLLPKSPYVYPETVPVYRQVDEAGISFPDFTYAAENAVNGVVHVKVLKREQVRRQPSVLDYFFGYGDPYSGSRESVNAGSGVIISTDGYIVTNNHVVENGVEFLVTMNNNKSLSARLIGADPATDIAVLKVEAEQLPAIPFGNSDSLRLGEWVLAIGNPFNLRSTVTAGIVSAKGRALPDATGDFKIESFIQTDAAVNPGNSGGALVNTKGELVGINTAIASNTGSFTGYSFAVPSTIARKVVSDIREYGTVQRGMLGISMQELNSGLADHIGYRGTLNGVYVPLVDRGGAAYRGGLRNGDVILSVNGIAVKSPSEVQEKVNGFNPGDKLIITVLRNGEKRDFEVELQGDHLSRALAGTGDREEGIIVSGAELVEAPREELRKLHLRKGVLVRSLEPGKWKDTGMQAGFIITHVNQRAVGTPEEVVRRIREAERSVLIEGVYGDGSVYYYGIGI